MERTNITSSQIELLTSKGFQQDDSKHSGFYFFEKSDPYQIWVLIPYLNYCGFKFEILQYDIDEEGVPQESMYTEPIKYMQSFEEFINFWIP